MLSWLDQRAEPDAVALAATMSPADQFAKLGAVVTGKDILPKILWLQRERQDVFRKTAKLLDCKEAVVMNLTGRAVTDYAGASAYRLFDLGSHRWSTATCEELGLPISMLPEAVPATAIAGGLSRRAAQEIGLLAGMPVVVGAGDVAASQVGAGATRVGDIHVSLGTAIYFGITLDEPATDPDARLGVLAHMDPDLWILWAEIATGGAALAWLARDVLGLGLNGSLDYPAIDRLVTECADDIGDLVFTPWLSGERVPLFDDQIRGAFIGLDLHHTPRHFLRALMEGVAFQMRWALDYALAFGQPIREIRAVGGGSIGDVWIQIIADVLGRPILTVANPQDAGAVGAAACGLVGLGLQPDFEFVRRLAMTDREFVPDERRRDRYAGKYRTFQRLYDALAPVYHAAAQAGDPA
jgi:xylulokinase